MANIFNSVSARVPKRHKFKLNHQVKLTGEMGQLLPIMCEPILPGDRFKVGTNQLVRFAPLVAPIMSDIDVYTHFFFVPNRIIWKDWETFITASTNGRKMPDEEVPVPPRLKIPAGKLNTSAPSNLIQDFWDGKKYGTNSSLIDYLGFPTVPNNHNNTDDADYFIDELPLRAYQRIYFDWFRDENLTDFIDFDFIDNDDYNNGDNDLSDNYRRSNLLLALQRRAWKKDYFTSALPWAQKGADVLIPGTGVDLSDLTLSSVQNQNIIKIKGNGSFGSPQFNVDLSNVQAKTGGSAITDTNQAEVTMQFGSPVRNISLYPGSFHLNTDDLIKGLSIGSSDSSVTEGTIRELRRAMAAQRFLEREAVGGTRYIEQILSFFGVKSSDARLQRSEFLGGSKQPVVISQVLQTSESSQNSPLGQPAGNAVSAGGKYLFDRTFEEHGFIIGIMSVIPRAEYKNGYPRKFLKRDRFDYYWPQFARIGEQPIETQELFYRFDNNSNEDPDPQNPLLTKNKSTFGYTPRYAEYRFINSTVHGDFKDTLEFWTLVRDYGETVPLLNKSFIDCNPSNRIFAYDHENDAQSAFNHLWIQVGFNISALRPLPKYGESI